MTEQKFLADQFETHRGHLRGVAYRMLGQGGEAEDAVQETWLRLARSDTSDVENLRAWLTTVVARVCLDMLRGRKARREDALDAAPEAVAGGDNTTYPEHDMLMADSVGLALLVVLERLTPAERVAFVLHDMFDLPFEEIAPIVGRTVMATRQLASRARRRVRGVETVAETDRTRQQKVVEAFLAASRNDDFEALLTMLDPDVVFRSDATAVGYGGAPELRGASAVAATFRGRAQAARPALIDGAVGVMVAVGGNLRIVLRLSFAEGRIATIDAVADPERLAGFQVSALG